MLVIMKDWNLHALAQFALNIEAVGCANVFEVDGAKGRLQRGNDVDQLGWVEFVDLDVKNIDTGELLEQHGLAFHHRLGRQWADVTQTKHGGAVGDDGDQIAAAGVLVSGVRVFDNFFARSSNAWCVGQSQVTLVDQLLGGGDGHFAGGRKFMVLKGGATQFVAFFFFVVDRRI